MLTPPGPSGPAPPPPAATASAKAARLDYLAFALLIAAGVGLSQVEPHHYRVLDTARLQYPVTEAQVPSWALLCLLLLPCACVLAYALVRRSAVAFELLRALAGSLSLSFTLTEVVKKLVGRPRPNFVALCQWAGGRCHAPRHDAMSAYQSFPSGHTSTTFSVYLLVTLFLVHRLPGAPGTFARVLPALLPSFVCAWVGITRIQDYWHNWDDVLAGAVLGSACAALAHSVVFGGGAAGGGEAGARRASVQQGQQAYTRL